MTGRNRDPGIYARDFFAIPILVVCPKCGAPGKVLGPKDQSGSSRMSGV